MANYKVIGVAESKGVFNGNPYRNLIIHTTYTDQYVVGEKVEQFKAKWLKLDEILALGMSASEVDKLNVNSFSNLVGKTVTLYFDKYRNVDRIIVQEDSAAKSK